MTKYFFKRTLSFILIIFVVAAELLCGCSKVEADFPEFSESNMSISAVSADITDVEASVSVDAVKEAVPHITVALPYSAKTLSRLAKLFYLKNNNMLGNAINGSNIALDYLDAVNVPFIIDSIKISPTGANVSTVSDWDNSGGIPDVFLTNDLSGVKEAGFAAPLNDCLYDNSLISNCFSSEALYECGFDSLIYGIPYGFSFEIMFANLDFIPAKYKENYAIESMSFVSVLSDVDKLNEMMMDIRNDYPDIENEGIVPLRSAYELLAQTNGISEPELQSIKEWYDTNLTSDYDYNSSTDSVYSRHAAMWIADSSEIDMWCDYYPDKICFFRLPNIGNEYKPLITLYPLCVSPQSENIEFASEFAAFVALDEDAQRLILRLENNMGIFPMIDSSNVWNSLTSDVVYGNIAGSIEEQLNSVVYSRNVIDNNEYKDILSAARDVVNSEEE
ncbi:MAG: hypothetical protein MJ153_01540 [Clostridia bacterium]|nr:hypothetical protein [Clostridia bacterium]